MLIGELADATGVPARLLRYYEEQGLLRPERTESGYREYDPSAVVRVHQIRGLLDTGLPTRIIRPILPILDRSADGLVRPADLPQEVVDLLEEEAARLRERVARLSRDLESIEICLKAVPPRPAP
ncbi:MerR family transcriptional regulator [Streptomyces sp. AK02-01A]|uniref:MerR family transcriptional regulator n=1 Tax=Streptomyces sp. AK02-01A TaxID=3028648 RepID=UPI0029A5F0D5|nr:MerR family transcriptional regulator [Streptomyces sp. AK02-01A]MDX3853761.1 MerR family transcriptional regulator [Streptomyces sp. AK02-01A]